MSSIQELSVRINANIDEFRSAMQEVTSSVRQAGDSVRDSMNGSERNTTGAIGKIKSALGGVAGVIAGAFAIDKIKDFGVSLVESAAESQAMTAQFEQVFGELQPAATKAIDGMGKEFGMVGSRIKPAFTQMTSLFKGLGLEGEEAMDGATRAMTASADAAAFYDVSMEDASSALTSFMKGNWEAGESIGLFANEAQMASYASDKLGMDYKNLDEAGKQLVRLSFAETMQKQSGAMGQAARESGSYQNQLGNLKQIWTDLKGQLGQPILTVAIAGIQALAGALGKVDAQAILAGFKAFGSYVGSVFSPIITAVKDNFVELFGNLSFDSGSLSSGFEGIKTAISGIGEAIRLTAEGIGWFIDKFDFLIAGVAAGVITFKAITAAKAAWVTITTAWTAVTTAATAVQAAFNLVLAANPIAIVVIAIGALVAAGILLYKNWDTVVEFLKVAWEAIKSAAVTVFDYLKDFFSKWGTTILAVITGPIGLLVLAISRNWDSIKATTSKVWDGIKSFLSGLWSGIKTLGESAFNGLKSYFSTVFEAYKTIITVAWNTIKTFLSNLWNEIKSIASTVFEAIKTSISNIFEKIKTTVLNIWEAIKTSLSNTFSAIKTSAENTWNNIKTSISNIVETIKSTVSNKFNSLKDTISNIWNTVKTSVTNTAESIRSAIVTKLESAKSSASTIFNNLKTAMTKPIEEAKTAISNAIDKIKGFFSNLKLKFPDIKAPKLPKFTLTGKFSLMPPSVPKVGISWNAKGGVFNKPTVFNTANAGLQGVGETGSEAIIPLTAKVLGGIGKGIASTMSKPDNATAGDTYVFNMNIESMSGTRKDADNVLNHIQQQLRRNKGVK